MNSIGYISLGISIVFLGSILGAAIVFFLKRNLSPKLKTVILGFAAGVMLAASVFGLLIPAIEMAKESETLKNISYLPAIVGLLGGALLLIVLGRLIPHKHTGTEEEHGHASKLRKETKFFLAVVIHNVPEGLAAGLAFGTAMIIDTPAAYLSALSLSIGIAIQNVPETVAVSMPLYNVTGSKLKSFGFGVLSGAVEPVAAVLGLLVSSRLNLAMAWFLSLAAGAMIFVTVEDLIPDAKLENTPNLGATAIIVGFCVMMLLDIMFG